MHQKSCCTTLPRPCLACAVASLQFHHLIFSNAMRSVKSPSKRENAELLAVHSLCSHALEGLQEEKSPQEISRPGEQHYLGLLGPRHASPRYPMSTCTSNSPAWFTCRPCSPQHC